MMNTAERRVSRQLDIVHFFQNATMLETLSKLSLSKTDRCLIRRQPKVHLLSQQTSSPASSDTQSLNAYQTSSNLELYDGLPN